NISGGTVNITEEIYGDGIQAENVNISAGNVNITTVFNNAAVAYYTSGSSSTTLNTITEKNDKYKTERINVCTGDHAGIKAGTKASTRIYSDLKSSDPDNATKTYSASGGLTISGGTVVIDTLGAGLKSNRVTGYTACDNGVYIVGSPDDALHSNNSMSVTGGTVILYASDDGITAAGDLTITGSDTTVDIRSSFEGIEAANITFGTSGSETGPSVAIVSDDDGINAAQKTNVTYAYDSSENEDYNYTKTTEKSGGNKCTVYSGSVTINIDSASTKTRMLRNGSAASTKSVTYMSDGDGIDCNGTLDLEGGVTTVFGASPSTSNSPIDTDEGFTLGTSAVLLAAGSDGMNESKPQDGGGTYIYYGGSGSSGTPGVPGSPGNPGNFGGPSVPGNPGGMPGDVAASISAGSVFKVTSGNSVLTETTIPYAASFLIYASPALAASEYFTATLNGSAVSMTRASAGSVGTDDPVVPVCPIGPVCPEGPTEPEQPVATTPVKKIKLNTTKVSIGVGRTYQLSVASVTPADASSRVTWTSADSSIASVDKNTGIVTAVSTGLNKKGIPNKTKTVKITATASDGSGKTAVCTVTVGNAVTDVNFYVNGDKTKSVVTEAEVARSKKIKLIPVYTTTYSSQGMIVPMNKKLIWSSSDESVAKVSNGVITGLKRGEVTITAKTAEYAGCTEGGDVVANCKVTVIVPVTSAKLKKVISIKQGAEYDMNLNLVVLPADAQYSVKWSTSDDSIASVGENTGVITASTQKTGTAKISATVTSTQGNYVKTITKNVKVTAK
ncbi:MAG: Ig-like domain-containing protein, partial [Lachnospiraceae bacterium]|nr:Ig-like domain-containing protein [Lachnospiraceae bacterium]